MYDFLNGFLSLNFCVQLIFAVSKRTLAAHANELISENVILSIKCYRFNCFIRKVHKTLGVYFDELEIVHRLMNFPIAFEILLFVLV